MTDANLAAHLAHEAGQILLTLRDEWAGDPRLVGKAGDEAANAWLMAALRDARPDDMILSEEEADSAARLTARRVWIIDPVDGTREYGEGRSDWAVHVALAVNLFNSKALSLGMAARVARMSRLEFTELLGQLEIPVVDYPASELTDELTQFAR
ncbi:MAG: hypothetical protein HC788_00010 [Sphingopyxis sp.]|nr:hypothetical protein [Sphingopyxis sp.]